MIFWNFLKFIFYDLKPHLKRHRMFFCAEPAFMVYWIYQIRLLAA